MYDSKIPKCSAVMKRKKMISFRMVLLLLSPYLFLLTFHTPLSLQFVYAIVPDTVQHISLFKFTSSRKKIACLSTNKMNQKILFEKMKRHEVFSVLLLRLLLLVCFFLFKSNESSAKRYGICNQLFLYKKKGFFTKSLTHTHGVRGTYTPADSDRKQISLM